MISKREDTENDAKGLDKPFLPDVFDDMAVLDF
jgi:hypothetical protein